jgi:hypothetical protein
MMPTALVRTYLPLLLLTGVLLLQMCNGGSEVIADRGGSEVIARLVTEDGDPVVGAEVLVLDYTFRDSLGVTVPDTQVIASTISDDSGKCTFEKIKQIPYYLSATYGDDSLILAPYPFTSDSEVRVDLGTLIMKAPGAIQGVVFLVSGGTESDIHCYIAGTSFGAITNSTTPLFTISGIFPVDTTYTLTVTADGYKRVTLSGITVSAGMVAILPDTILLDLDPVGAPPSPEGLTVQYDTVSGDASVRWNTVNVEDVGRYIVYHCNGASCLADTVDDTSATVSLFTDPTDMVAKTVLIQVSALDDDNNEGSRSPFDTVAAIPPAWNTIATSVFKVDGMGSVDTAYVAMQFAGKLRSVVSWTWWADDPDSVIDSWSGEGIQSGGDTIVWPAVNNKKRLYISLTDDRGAETVDSIDARFLLPIDVWSTADSLRYQRCYAGAAVIDGKIYVFGGGLLMQTASYQITILGQKTAERYDPATGEWSGITSMKQKRYMAASAVVNGKIYVFGGSDGSQDLATVEMYDPVADVWEIVDTMSRALVGASAAAIDGIIYITGGLTGTSEVPVYLSTITSYDPASGTWGSVGKLNSARNLHQTVVVADRLVTIGGLGIDTETDLPVAMRSFECTDVGAGNSCPLSLAQTSVGRCRFGATVIEDRLVVLGGTNVTDRINPLNTVEVFFTDGTIISSGADIPVALEGMAVVAIDGRIYCIGGITVGTQGSQTSKAVYVYYP